MECDCARIGGIVRDLLSKAVSFYSNCCIAKEDRLFVCLFDIDKTPPCLFVCCEPSPKYNASECLAGCAPLVPTEPVLTTVHRLTGTNCSQSPLNQRRLPHHDRIRQRFKMNHAFSSGTHVPQLQKCQYAIRNLPGTSTSTSSSIPFSN